MPWIVFSFYLLENLNFHAFGNQRQVLYNMVNDGPLGVTPNTNVYKKDVVISFFGGKSIPELPHTNDQTFLKFDPSSYSIFCGFSSLRIWGVAVKEMPKVI